jgi:hypothetical protein
MNGEAMPRPYRRVDAGGMQHAEPQRDSSRHTCMKLVLMATVMVATAACGGSSGGQHLAVSPPGGTQAPLQDATVTPPASAEASPSDAVYAPQPASAAATAGTASAGTASSGPGRVSSPAASPSPRPTPSAVGGTVTVTDDDSESTVHLRVGQHLRVRLSSGTWDPPVSSAASVVARRSSSGGYPSDQPVDATFEAVGKGTADVTAQSDAACFHTEPRCMMASRQWRVHVVVG